MLHCAVEFVAVRGGWVRYEKWTAGRNQARDREPIEQITRSIDLVSEAGRPSHVQAECPIAILHGHPQSHSGW